MLSRLVIAFLPRSKHLLISWLQSLSAVILEPKKIKSDTVSTVSSSISREVMGPDAMIFIRKVRVELKGQVCQGVPVNLSLYTINDSHEDTAVT